jgi:peptidyl-prolyl cis-trans isomerase D
MSIQTIKDNSQGIIAKIIVGLIVLTFALFGADAIIGYSNNNQKAATVNGEDISELDLLRASDFVKRQILSDMGEQADPALINDQQVRARALNELIERQLMVQVSQEQGISVSDKRINDTILKNENFQTDGVFDREKYTFSLRNLQITPLDYKLQLNRDMLMQQPQLGLLVSAFITKPELTELTRVDRQHRDFSYVLIEAKDLAGNVVISDAQIQSYYNANQSNYMTEETLNIEYLELKQSDFATNIDIEEAEIQQLLDQENAVLASQEERRSSHILISTEKRTSDEAETLIADIQQKLENGDSFDELAKTHSDDSFSAEKGGDLGFFGKGTFVPAFDKALFALSKNQISDIVDTEFGLHLIRLDEIRLPEPLVLANEHDRLIKLLRFQKAEETFVAAAENLQNDSFSAGDLHEPAQNQDLTIQTSEPFTSKEGQGIAANDKVRRIAFSDELLTEGNNSDLIELAKDHVIIIRAKEHKPSKPHVFEEVAESIKAELTEAAAQRSARKLGEQILAEVRGGKTLEQVSSVYGYSLQTHEQASRVKANVNPQILVKLFTLPKPEEGKISSDSLITNQGDFVVIALNNVSDGDIAMIPEQETAQLERFLVERLGEQDLQGFLESMHESADIEKF